MPVLDPATSPVLAPATAPKKPSVFEDLIDVFYAPSQVFDRRRDGEFFVVLLVVTLVSQVLIMAFWNVLEPAFSAETSRALAEMVRKNPQIKPEMAESMRGRMEAGPKYFTWIGVPIAAFFGALIVWLVGKFLDASLSLGQAMTVSTYSLVPTVLTWIAMAISGFLVPPEDVRGIGSLTVGPLRFLDPVTTPKALLGLAQRVDPFQIWSVILTGIGVAVIARVSRGRGMAVAAVAWVLGTLATIGFTVLQG